MVPKQLTLHGFKSFEQTFTFQFPMEKGLFFVTGKNEVEPELEANGCGKSTLFCDALCWCLYGKTPRGVKAGDIVHWDSTTAWVDFHFESRGTAYRVQRCQSPNSLLLSIGDGQPFTITQEDLQQRLGLDYSAFCNSIVFSQLTDTFFDLRPAEKSEVLESVLPLDVWEHATQRARQRSTKLQKDIQAQSESLAGVKGQLAALSELQLDDQIAEWEVERQEEIKTIEETMQQDHLKLEDFKRSGASLQKKEAVAKQSVAEVEELLREAEQEYNTLYQEMVVVERAVSAKATTIALWQQEIDKIKKLGPVCGTCKQKIGDAYRAEEENKYQVKILDQSKALKLDQQHKADVQQQLRTIGVDVGEIKNARNEVLDDYNDLKQQLNTVKWQVSQLLELKRQKELKLEQWKTKTNPFIDQKKSIEANKRQLRAKIVQMNAQLAELNTTLLSTEYWIKGFSEVKLMLISDVLAQLELEVNNYLYQFGLHHWKIEFSVESTTKSGKSRKGFSVVIKPPHLDQSVPWSAWSGGEIQRLRLAGALGMSDLILTCFGLSPGLEVWDEPSCYLSQQGISQLLEVLKERANTTGRQIFLIDHRNLDSTTFEGVYTVVKSDDGSHVIND